MVDLAVVGLILIFAGFVVVAISLLTPTSRPKGVRGAGVILVGPIPIIFDSDAKWASLALALAIILTVLMILFYLV